MKKILCLTMVMSMVFLFACAKKGEQKAAATGYLAKIGSVTITQEDVTREMKGLPPQIQKMFEGPAGTEKFVEELVKKEILYQEAKKKGLENNDQYKKKVEDFKKLTLISVLLEKEIEEKAKLSDKDVKDYYEAHKNELSGASQIRASHILVKNEDEAKKILEQLKKGGDFAKIAKEKSIDSGSAQNGGDLGFFSRGQMVPEFEKAAASLKKGELSGVVKTQYGYHIIKVTDRKEGSAVEFDKVKDLLTQKLTAEKQKELFDSYINTLKTTYKPVINKEAIAKIANTKPSGPEGKEEEKGTGTGTEKK